MNTKDVKENFRKIDYVLQTLYHLDNKVIFKVIKGNKAINIIMEKCGNAYADSLRNYIANNVDEFDKVFEERAVANKSGPIVTLPIMDITSRVCMLKKQQRKVNAKTSMFG